MSNDLFKLRKSASHQNTSSLSKTINTTQPTTPEIDIAHPTPKMILHLQRTIGNRATTHFLGVIHQNRANSSVIQRLPQKNGNKWSDDKILGKSYSTLKALLVYHSDLYHDLDGAELHQFLKFLRDHLQPSELRDVLDKRPLLVKKIMGNDPQTNLVVQVRVRIIKFPGNENVADAITQAQEILERYGIRIHIVGEETPNLSTLRLGALTPGGEYKKDSSVENQWALIKQYAQPDRNTLPIIWMSDFEGYNNIVDEALDNKPKGTTLHLVKGSAPNQSSRTGVIMRPGMSGQTLAHEIGHALGGIKPSVNNKPIHGDHVDIYWGDFFQKNLMHSTPYSSGYDVLNPEQVAAFKASPFVEIVQQPVTNAAAPTTTSTTTTTTTTTTTATSPTSDTDDVLPPATTTTINNEPEKEKS